VSVADAHVAGDRPALLRHAGLVEHLGRLALEMRGHGQDRADA
jgi:hypothetical protein